MWLCNFIFVATKRRTLSYLKSYINLQETRTGVAYKDTTEENNSKVNFVLVEVLISLVNAVLPAKENTAFSH